MLKKLLCWKENGQLLNNILSLTIFLQPNCVNQEKMIDQEVWINTNTGIFIRSQYLFEENMQVKEMHLFEKSIYHFFE